MQPFPCYTLRPAVCRSSLQVATMRHLSILGFSFFFYKVSRDFIKNVFLSVLSRWQICCTCVCKLKIEGYEQSKISSFGKFCHESQYDGKIGETRSSNWEGR